MITSKVHVMSDKYCKSREYDLPMPKTLQMLVNVSTFQRTFLMSIPHKPKGNLSTTIISYIQINMYIFIDMSMIEIELKH